MLPMGALQGEASPGSALAWKINFVHQLRSYLLSDTPVKNYPIENVAAAISIFSNVTNMSQAVSCPRGTGELQQGSLPQPLRRVRGQPSEQGPCLSATVCMHNLAKKVQL